MNERGGQKIPILIVARDAYPPFRVDITALFSKYLTGDLKIGWLMRSDASGPRKVIASDDETYHVIRGRGVAALINTLGAHLTALGRIIRGDYAIVQCRDAFLAATLYAIVARLRGVPFVYWMSYPMEEGYLHRAKSRFANGEILQGLPRWMIGMAGRVGLYGITLRLSSHIFAQSLEMKRGLVEAGIAPDRITTVPMGIDVDVCSEKNYIEASGDFYTGNRVVLYLGSIDPVRQMHIPAAGVVKALKRKPDLVFVVIGRASVQERQRVADAFSEFPSRLIFLDQMPLAEALGHVRRADVCLASYPTTDKLLNVGTPTKIVEYLAMGARVVANRHPDQTLVIEGAGLGILCEFEPEDFCKAILRALDMGRASPAERRRATAWIRANRDYQMLSKRVASIYRRLAPQ